MIPAALSRGMFTAPGGCFELVLYRHQLLNHTRSRLSVGDDLVHFADDVFGGEIVLHKFPNNFLFGDQIDHGKV